MATEPIYSESILHVLVLWFHNILYFSVIHKYVPITFFIGKKILDYVLNSLVMSFSALYIGRILQSFIILTLLKSTGHLFCRLSFDRFASCFLMIRLRLSPLVKYQGGNVFFSYIRRHTHNVDFSPGWYKC